MISSGWIKGFFAGSLLASCLVGCSSDDDSGTIVIPPPTRDDTSTVPMELQYNYELLAYLYFYAHLNKEISENVEDYYRAPLQEDYGYSMCTIDYTDVCYMYSKMSDPFTRYYDPYYAPYILDMLEQSDQEVGIGAEYEFVEKSNTLVITEVYSKSPADKAGLAEGDTVISIRGASPTNEDAAQALLSGKDGDEIALGIKRGDDTSTVRIQLATYATPTVKLRYQDSIPVIRITEFTPQTVSDSGTYGEFVQALRKTEGAKSTIIDLRGNPGGDVDQCNAISAELLSKGDTIIIDVETNVDSILEKGQWTYFQIFDTVAYTVTVDGSGRDRYYVFLADSMSASCAEVMLSSISVNKKSPIVGLTSYGKGIGQRVLVTIQNGLSLITGLQSIDREGNVYHKVGIVPDFESGDPEEQMAKAVEWARDGSMIRTAGYGTTSTGHFAKARAMGKQEFGLPKNRQELLRQLGGKISFPKR